jgi:hypothetical protein
MGLIIKYRKPTEEEIKNGQTNLIETSRETIQDKQKEDISIIKDISKMDEKSKTKLVSNLIVEIRKQI